VSDFIRPMGVQVPEEVSGTSFPCYALDGSTDPKPARTDTERLEWLEDEIAAGRGPEFVEAEYCDHFVVASAGFRFGSVGAGRLREAIDIAMDTAASQPKAA
jgi:hypothetical protein